MNSSLLCLGELKMGFIWTKLRWWLCISKSLPFLAKGNQVLVAPNRTILCYGKFFFFNGKRKSCVSNFLSFSLSRKKDKICFTAYPFSTGTTWLQFMPKEKNFMQMLFNLDLRSIKLNEVHCIPSTKRVFEWRTSSSGPSLGGRGYMLWTRFLLIS